VQVAAAVWPRTEKIGAKGIEGRTGPHEVGGPRADPVDKLLEQEHNQWSGEQATEHAGGMAAGWRRLKRRPPQGWPGQGGKPQGAVEAENPDHDHGDAGPMPKDLCKGEVPHHLFRQAAALKPECGRQVDRKGDEPQSGEQNGGGEASSGEGHGG